MAVRISRLGGFINDDTVNSTPSVDCLFEADAAISVGHGVMLDTAGNTSGRLVISATAALEHLLVGIYTGEGGTGSETTSTNNQGGNDAVDGDPVWVRTYGPALGRYDTGGTDTLSDAGETMTIHTDAGEFADMNPTESTVGLIPSVVLLEATLADDALYWMFVRCM